MSMVRYGGCNMSQEMEYEKKLLLTYEEFLRIKRELPFPNEPIVQKNDYFETKKFDLRKRHCALRIRTVASKYILTLKETRTDGILETNATLTVEEVRQWKNNTFANTNEVTNRLHQLNILLESLRWIGSLTTKRWVYETNDATYMLDQSFYNDIVDYEIEVEAQSLEQASDALQRLIETFQLERKETLPKIGRLYATLSL